MDKVILIICYEQHYLVKYEENNFSHDCKSEKEVFNCVCKLIRLKSSEIDHLEIQEEGMVQQNWTCEEFASILEVCYPDLYRDHWLA